MEHPENLLWIIGAAVLLFAISFLGKKAEWFLNLVLRSVFGVIFMYFLNWGIEILGFTVAVGINESPDCPAKRRPSGPVAASGL